MICDIHIGDLESTALNNLRRVLGWFGTDLGNDLNGYAVLFHVRQRGEKISANKSARPGDEHGFACKLIEVDLLANVRRITRYDVGGHGLIGPPITFHCSNRHTLPAGCCDHLCVRARADTQEKSAPVHRAGLPQCFYT